MAAAPVRVLQQGGPARNPVAAKPPCCNPGAHMRAVAAPARPGRADIDPLLAGPLRRIVVAGIGRRPRRRARAPPAPGPARRRARLRPADRRSAAARLWGLPHGAAAVELAREGVARPAPLVRDDAGGVLVGRGEIRGTAGSVHGEAYCDGVLALRGSAAPAGGDAVAGRRLDLPTAPPCDPRRPIRRRPAGGPPRARTPRGRGAGEPLGRPARRPAPTGAGDRPHGPGQRRRPRRPGGLPARHRGARRRGAPAARHAVGLVPARRRLAARPTMTAGIPIFDGP